MTIHKLAAGSGYEYLTRQVAAGDSTELGGAALADYYAAQGEAPGHWVGSGLAAFTGPDGIGPGEVVTAGQMGHLFGAGEHPATGRPLGRRTRPDGVAGFDLTFSPVKSVSALWAVAPPAIARAIERAHDAAVNDALAYVECEVLFTREGTDGARQVETRGLLAAAFRHRDSRAGDPDLHTHVAVANKVQAKHSGRWLTVYGRVLFQHTVAISETYNTALEYRLSEALGVTFAERTGPRERRPVREIVGVSAGLCRVWSRRARDIDRREDDLVTTFVDEYGRPPTEPERLRLVQQANLETRAPKHEPRAEADQRRIWRRQASEFLGSESTLDAMIRTALDASQSDPGPRSGEPMEAHLIRAMAVAVITELETRRATWQSWHLRAEAARQVRAAAHGQISADDLSAVTDEVVAAAVGMSVLLTPDDDPVDRRTDIREPSGLRRSDGTSVHRHTGADHYTSQRILQAEQRLVDAAGLGSDFAFSPEEIDIVLAASTFAGARLNDGQRALVHALAGNGHRVQLALAPAGSGKTTAVAVLAAIWTTNGYHAIGLAPSAAAAKVLQDATGLPCETLAKIDDEILTQNHTGRDHRNGLSTQVGPETLVVIDEAGMADTLTLDRVVTFCISRGATIRLLGDDQQLSAVGAGGVLRDIAHRRGADRLEDVVRFTDPGEAAASLDLRDGDRTAIGFYLDHDRVHTGDDDTTMAEVLTAWQHDRDYGLDALMLAPTRDMVATLNQLARTQRLGGITPRTKVELADGNQASAGDTIITRHNQRRLTVSGTDWVKNGDRWTITRIRRGALTVRHATTGLRAVLPAEYVADHVELGYASTVHTAQGLTADVVHGIVDGREDRQLLYTMLTRGRRENHVHVVLEPVDPVDADREQCMLPGLEEQMTATKVLYEVIARDGAEVSATTTLRRGRSCVTQLHDASVRYADAVTTGAMRVLGSGWEDALDAAGEGPLPWLPAVPAALAHDESWGPYLAARARHVEVTAQGFLNLGDHDAPPPPARRNRPAWIVRYADMLGNLHDTVALWRAARGVPEDDPRPTGPAVTDPLAARFQRHLLRQLTDRHSESVCRWHELIIRRTGIPTQDDHARGEAIELARMLDTLHRRGHDAHHLLNRALACGRLPESHAIAALTYRIRKLTAHDPLQSRRESPRHAGPWAPSL